MDCCIIAGKIPAIFMNCVSVIKSSFGKKMACGKCVACMGFEIWYRHTPVTLTLGELIHFCQNEACTCSIGAVTMSRGVFRWPIIESKRLQSFVDSGMKVISHGYAKCHAFESCLESNNILYWNAWLPEISWSWNPLGSAQKSGDGRIQWLIRPLRLESKASNDIESILRMWLSRRIKKKRTVVWTTI